MRIGIDMRMAGTGEGIGRYVEELVKHLSIIDKENEYYLLINEISPPKADPLLADNFPARLDFVHAKSDRQFPISKTNFHVVKTRAKYYSFAEQTKFISELRRLKLDLVHFTNFNLPILYPGKFVTTIHDVIHHSYPGKKMSHLFHRLAYRLVINTAVRRASKVIAVSEATKNDILKVFRIYPNKVSVIHEGVDPNFTVRPVSKDGLDKVKAKYGIAKPYLFFAGVWRQYKNLPRLAAAFDILKQKYGRDYELVLAGKIDPFYPEIAREVFAVKHSKDIKALGYIPDADLRTLYVGAKMFVLPSLVEGFGLIGLEAQAAGAPVGASDIPVLREVLGEGAIFFDPSSVEDIAGKINQALSSQGFLDELSQKGKANARKFDWRETARETLEVYKEVVSSKVVSTYMKETFTAGGIVVNMESRMILVVSQGGRSWSLPKGHVNERETPEEAARREIYEESGLLELRLVKQLGSYQRYKIGFEEPDDPSELKNITMFLFETDHDELRPVDPNNPEARWVEKDKVADMLTHEKDKTFFMSIMDKI